MVDKKVLDKYIKIMGLVQRGEEHEKNTARSIAAKMLAQHPTLSDAYSQYVYEEMMRERAEDPDIVEPEINDTDKRNSSSFWDFARSVYETASDFANTMTDAVHGTRLARHVKVLARLTRKESISISFNLTPEILDSLDEFNYAQRAAFQTAILEKIKHELDEILFPSSDD